MRVLEVDGTRLEVPAHLVRPIERLVRQRDRARRELRGERVSRLVWERGAGTR